MEVDVEDVLPGRLAVCEEEVHALAAKRRASKGGCCDLTNTKQLRTILRVEVGEIRGMCARDDQHMTANERLDVHECDRPLVLVYDADFGLTRREPAKETVRHGSRPRRRRRSPR